MTLPHPALASGNVALITGAAGGIGLAMARRFVDLGLRDALVDLESDRLRAAATDLGPQATAFAADVSNATTMDQLALSVGERLGAVAVLANNAGRGGGGDALSNPQGWIDVLGVYLMGVLLGTQRFVPAMVASDKAGLVINTGSKQGITQPPGDTAYNVSKAGVKALTEGLAHTLREKTDGRVTAHLLIPGFTYTGMIARHIPQQPPGAWTAEQVVDRMLEGLVRDEFYILCQDNETTRDQDLKRIAWSMGDLIESRPALSRWHPQYKEAFQRHVDGD